MCHRGVAGGIFVFFGIAIIVVSLVASSIVKHILREQLQYTPNTVLYSQWEKATVTDFFLYIMNVTNPDAVLNGSKPVLEEIGPYVYEQYKNRLNNSFSEDMDTLFYYGSTYYVFHAGRTKEENNGAALDPGSDLFTVPNVLFHSVLAMCADPQSALAAACKLFEYGSFVEFGVRPFEVLTVDELIWGHQTEFSEFMSDLSQGQLAANFSLVQNNTLTKLSAVRTGRSDSNSVGQFVLWQNQSHLNYWGSEYANMINGTSGTVFRSNLKRDDVTSVAVFVDQVFRSFDLYYQYDVSVKDITCRRYILTKDDMANATMRPEQAVWYAFGPSGLLNMSVTQGGAPIFISKPHFLDSEPELLDNVTINATASRASSLRDTTLDVEPITGVVLSAVKAMQTNIYVQPHHGPLAAKLNMENIRAMYFPIFWLQVMATVAPSDAANFRSSIILPYTITSTAYHFIGVGLGGVLVLLGVGLIYSHYRKVKRSNSMSTAMPQVGTDDGASEPLISNA